MSIYMGIYVCVSIWIYMWVYKRRSFRWAWDRGWVLARSGARGESMAWMGWIGTRDSRSGVLFSSSSTTLCSGSCYSWRCNRSSSLETTARTMTRMRRRSRSSWSFRSWFLVSSLESGTTTMLKKLSKRSKGLNRKPPRWFAEAAIPRLTSQNGNHGIKTSWRATRNEDPRDPDRRLAGMTKLWIDLN